VTLDPDCAIAHWHYFDVFSSGPLSKTLRRNSDATFSFPVHGRILYKCVLSLFNNAVNKDGCSRIVGLNLTLIITARGPK
jgi:hypothetical protein